jgi:hypothetical protein
MILSVASGKGGTGKTTVSVNLARMLDSDVRLLDCDVEEPNDHLFLKGATIKEEPSPSRFLRWTSPFATAAENAAVFANTTPSFRSGPSRCSSPRCVTAVADVRRYAPRRPFTKWISA